MHKKCKGERLKEEVYFLVIGGWEFATERGRHFTTGLIKLGLFFNTVSKMRSHNFRIFSERKFWLVWV